MPLLWGLSGNIQAPGFPSRSQRASPMRTRTSLGLAWSEEGREEEEEEAALCSFSSLPTSALYSPSAYFPNPQHIDHPPTSLSPDFILRTKQLDRGGASPAGPDLSCKRKEKKKKKDDASFEETGAKRERRGSLGREKHKQRCFNMMVASGARRKVEEGGKRKNCLQYKILWMVAWRRET